MAQRTVKLEASTRLTLNGQTYEKGKTFEATPNDAAGLVHDGLARPKNDNPGPAAVAKPEKGGK